MQMCAACVPGSPGLGDGAGGQQEMLGPMARYGIHTFQVLLGRNSEVGTQIVASLLA